MCSDLCYCRDVGTSLSMPEEDIEPLLMTLGAFEETEIINDNQ